MIKQLGPFTSNAHALAGFEVCAALFDEPVVDYRLGGRTIEALDDPRKIADHGTLLSTEEAWVTFEVSDAKAAVLGSTLDAALDIVWASITGMEKAEA